MKKLLVLFFLVSSFTLLAQKKTNVLLFLVDDLGYYDLSATGSQLYETPSIDALADVGMSFTNAYSSHPRCVPSRYGIQTGKFPARGQVPGGKGSLKVNDYTIGEAFKDAGYTTFFAGKWHLGHTEEEWPQNQGYDYNFGGCSAGAPISYFYPYNLKKDQQDKSNHRKIIGLEEGVEGEYLTDRLTNETISFIKNNKDKPFFALLAHYGVHTPFQAKKDAKKKYKDKVEGLSFSEPVYITKDGTTKMYQDNAIYAAMIESVDESLGRIIDALKECGIYENTAIVFTSDHGGLSNRGIDNKRKLATSNLPLRAGKGHVYEGGIKVPFIVYWQGEITAGSNSSQVTANTDIFPTVLEIAGVNNRTKDIDGISIVPALKGKKDIKRTLFWHSPMARPQSTGDNNCSVIRVGGYKLLDYYDQKKIELFNLQKDPYEENDLSKKNTKTTKKLYKKLNYWKKDINAIHKN